MSSAMAGERVVLVGCVKLKQDRRARAKDLYRSPLWQRRRRYAEESDCTWLILSAKHGLLDPDKRIAPYDLALRQLPAEARRSWGERVVRQLEDRFGSIAGTTFEVHAGAPYVRSIEPGIVELGGRVLAPLAHLGQGKQLAWYTTGAAASSRGDREDALDGPRLRIDCPDAQVARNRRGVGRRGELPTRMATFTLQFPASDIQCLARRYSYEDDGRLLTIGATATARGYYTRREFIEVCAWKTPRSHSRVAANSRYAVTSRTGRALAATEEPKRIKPLLELRGVGVPTASTLLYVAFPRAYPILDVRALESLGVKSRSTYTVSFWLQYLDACRELARDHGVSLRTLDKALWQYSKERSGTRRHR